jgi:hypothetical protein
MERRWSFLTLAILLIVVLQDNTVVEIPDEIDLAKFLCSMDNTYCQQDEEKTPRLYGKEEDHVFPCRPGWRWRF